MIEYKSEINNFSDLQGLCWSGAIDRLNIIEENNLEDEFFDYLQELCSCYNDLTLTDINDLIWFECDEWIDEHTNNNEEEE